MCAGHLVARANEFNLVLRGGDTPLGFLLERVEDVDGVGKPRSDTLDYTTSNIAGKVAGAGLPVVQLTTWG